MSWSSESHEFYERCSNDPSDQQSFCNTYLRLGGSVKILAGKEQSFRYLQRIAAIKTYKGVKGFRACDLMREVQNKVFDFDNWTSYDFCRYFMTQA